MDLSNYVLVGRFDLPEPTRTTAPAGSLLAQEVSAVTYDWDTDTLFVVGDGGTSIVQVTKTGQLINSMTLAKGASPQGTEFYDPEGLTYIGNGQFVMTEERDRNAVLFTYQAGTTLNRADAKTVDLGSFVPNIGLEGVTYDPRTGGFIFVKEKDPEGLFQTTIDFNAGTASNASPTTEPVNLFDPTKLGLLDFADIYALSSNPLFASTSQGDRLLVLSQESGKILEIDRAGNILSSLTIVSNPGNPLDVPSQQHEGLTVDAQGNLYVVSENGGGDFDHPQVWVYKPSTAPNLAPTGISLTNAVTMIDENTSTAARIKVADVTIADDGIGNNTLNVTGADKAAFEVDSTGLYIKAGTVLDFETKTSYAVTVTVDDTTVGATPDASTSYTLAVRDIAVENAPPKLYISEVAPWSSGNSPFAADWFEVTNGGSSAISLTGWKMDDSSFSFASSVALNGVSSIAPGESVIFIETSSAATVTGFVNTWFGGVKPANVQIGTYSGGGVGLSTGGDGVALFDAGGTLQAQVSFGASPAGPFPTFDNAAGRNNATISDLSKVGLHAAFTAPGDATAVEIGSPGSVGRIIVSEVAPWSSGNSPVGADWFEVTNTSAFGVNIAGWKMDDNSGSAAAAVALNGITTIAAGESVIFIETASQATVATFIATWFGGNPPPGLQIGTYSGSGVGLSTGGDAVNLYDATNALRASVSFGASPAGPYPTFDNSAGLNGVNVAINKLSVVGVNGAFVAANDPAEGGSPGKLVFNTDPVVINAAPVAVDDTLSSVKEGAGGRTIAFSTLLANDLPAAAGEVGQTLTVSAVGNATGGTVGIVNGAVVFNPTPDFSGTAGFDYTVRDNGKSYGLTDPRSDVGRAQFAIEFVNQAPRFTSLAMVQIAENSLLAATVTATDREGDAISFALTGGADRGFFAIDANSGAISFLATPDFETPEDAGGNNVYNVEITATDALGNATVQALAIGVTDVVEVGRTITGGNGSNVLVGTTGDDIISARNGSDTAFGGDGNDTLVGGNGRDVLIGGRGADSLDGANGDDRLEGGVGNDSLNGGRGDDVLIGGTGADRLTGGSGADRFVFAAGDSTLANPDQVLDFNGREGDRFDFTALGIEKSDIVIAKTGAKDYTATVDLNHDGVADFSIAIHSDYGITPTDFIV